MERFEHCLLEYYWSHGNTGDPAQFRPAFTVFHPDGRAESVYGGNVEITAALNRLGSEGWRVVSSVTAMNWILWTLERKLD